MKMLVLVNPLLLALLPPAVQAQDQGAQPLLARIREQGQKVDSKLLCRLASLRTTASLVAVEEALGFVRAGTARATLIAEIKHYAGTGPLESQALDLLEKLASGPNATDRRSAASVFTKFGESGHERLSKLLAAAERAPATTRSALVRALGAFEPLRDYPLLEHLARADRHDQVRYEALRAIARDPRSVPTLLEAIHDPYVLIPAVALDGLRRHHYPGRKAIAIEMAAGAKLSFSPALAVIRILAEFPDLDTAEALYDLGRRLTSTPRTAALRALHSIDSAAVEKMLIRRLQASAGSIPALLFALEAIGPRRSKAIAAAVRKLLKAKSAGVRCAAIRAAGKLDDHGAAKTLKRLARASDPEVRAAAIGALSRIESADPAWRKSLLRMLHNKSAITRAAAADALGELRHGAAAPELIRLLRDHAWQVQVASIRALIALRDARAVPALIELMERSEGRMLEEIARALRRLTGMPFRRYLPDWQRWWRDQGPGYELPPLDEVLAAEERLRKAREERARAGVQTSSGFYGIEVISKRVTFVIDHSGSMSAPAGTASRSGSKTTRLDIAKSELLGVLSSMDEKVRFNVISFGSGVEPWEKAIRRADKEAQREVRTYLRRIVASGGTNIHDALRKAFEDPDVDTIYFLTDGSPTSGAITDPIGIREAVRRWNQTRKIVIHTIAIGQNLDLLKWLSADSGGRHVYRR